MNITRIHSTRIDTPPETPEDRVINPWQALAHREVADCICLLADLEGTDPGKDGDEWGDVILQVRERLFKVGKMVVETYTPGEGGE